MLDPKEGAHERAIDSSPIFTNETDQSVDEKLEKVKVLLRKGQQVA